MEFRSDIRTSFFFPVYQDSETGSFTIILSNVLFPPAGVLLKLNLKTEKKDREGP